jgi:heme oxygenase (biliverdin-IX-beta and delta-forming)
MKYKDSTPKPGYLVRSLLRSAVTTTLGTTAFDTGKPYCSLILVGTNSVSEPLLLLSDLAVHSKNIGHSSEVSLLVSEQPADVDPLTQTRVTLQGQLVKEDNSLSLHRYLRRYATAEQFAGFTDFHLYRFIINKAHVVAGFGKIYWLDGDQITLAPHFLNDEDSETDIINHMNEDHTAAIQDIAAAGKTKRVSDNWKMIGLDPEGFDLQSGWTYQRILFKKIASNANDVRREFVRMVKIARE